MIICLSPEDLLNDARVLSHVYGDKLYKFTSEKKRFNATQLENETRITFLGHAHSLQFGEQLLSPSQFANQFEARGFPKDKPLTIDLVGCEIGFTGADKDQPSYMHQVYDELRKLGYHDIVVNSFTNLAAKEIIVEQRVLVTSITGGTVSNACTLVGFTKDEQSKYDDDKEVILLKGDLARVEKDIARIQEIQQSRLRVQQNVIHILANEPLRPEAINSTAIIDFSAVKPLPTNLFPKKYTEDEFYQYVKDNIKNININDFGTQRYHLFEAVKNGNYPLNNVAAEYQASDDETLYNLQIKQHQIKFQLENMKIKYFRTFATSDDVRKTFDSNANYQVNSQNYNDYTLPLHAKMPIRMLNDRIAELKLEIDNVKDSAVFSFFSDVDKKKEKLQFMQNIIIAIRSNPDIVNVVSLIDAAAKNNNLATARTSNTLAEIRNELENHDYGQRAQTHAPGR